VVEGVYRGQSIDLEARWGRGGVMVTQKETRGDTAVVTLGRTFSLSTLPCGLAGKCQYGQDVFLLGFPAGQGRYVDIHRGDRKSRELNPFARNGIISNISHRELVVDCVIQKGFSGGPVVVSNCSNVEPRIIGIISSGILFDNDRQLLNDDLGVTIRSGFTTCQTIDIAIEIIQDLFQH